MMMRRPNFMRVIGCWLGVLALGGALLSPVSAGGVRPASGSTSFGGQTDLSIEVPIYHGLEPDLRLVYDPQKGNGWTGVGWWLSGLSEIVRSTAGRGAPAYSDRDLYFLDGEELRRCQPLGSVPKDQSPSCQYPASAGQWGFTTRIEGYRRIRFEPSAGGGSWHVWDRDGTERLYRPRLSDLSGPSQVAGWHLARVSDTLGNQVTYDYWQNGDPLGTGEEYLKSISYNGTVINLYSEARPDPIDAADGKTLVVSQHRLKTIEVTVGGELLRAYGLEYENRLDGTERSMLSKVTQYGNDAKVDASGKITGGTAMPAIKLRPQPGGSVGSWNRPDPQVSQESVRPDTEKPSSIFQGQSAIRRFVVPREGDTPLVTGDVNGDGRSDWIKVTRAEDLLSPRLEIIVGLSNRKQPPSVVKEILYWPNQAQRSPFDRDLHVWATDVDGDGSDDLLMNAAPWKGQARNRRVVLATALSEHDGTFRMIQELTETGWTDSFGANGPDGSHVMRCQPADANDDGRFDLICAFDTLPDDRRSTSVPQFIGTALSRGDGTFHTVSVDAPDLDALHIPPDLAAGDIDGDGDSDVLLAYRVPDFVRSRANSTWVTGTSIGDGSYDFVERVKASNDQFHEWEGKLLAADINGDGRADFVRVVDFVWPSSPDGKGAVQTLTSRPDGTWTPNEQIVPNMFDEWDRLGRNITVGDANGDGAADLMIIMPVEAHPATSCSAKFDAPHTSFTRVIGNRDGTFQWPASWWADCSISTEKDINFERFLNSSGVQAADVNGDGTADFLTVFDHHRQFSGLYDELIVADVVSPTPATDGFRSIFADVNGDGYRDAIYVYSGRFSNTVYTLLRGGDGRYTQKPQNVMTGLDARVYRNWKAGDINADGCADLVYVMENSGDIWVDTLLSNCDGTWDELHRKAWEGYVRAYPAEAGRDTPSWRMMDVDGDGKFDLVHLARSDLIVRGSGGRTTAGLQINTLLSYGNGEWRPAPAHVGGQPINIDIHGYQSTDVNGDGRHDLVRMSSSVGLEPSHVDSLISGGNGTTWRLEKDPIRETWAAKATNRWRPVDSNGDGKTDLFRVDQTGEGIEVRSLLSNGNGKWTPKTAPNVVPDPRKRMAEFADTARWRVADVNRDGRTDLVHLLPLWKYYGNRPPRKGLQVDTLMSTGGGTWVATRPQLQLPDYDAHGALEFQAIDTNGDAATDLARIDNRSGSLQVTTLESAAPLDLLYMMDNGLGAKTEINYRASSRLQTRSPPTPQTSGCHLPHGLVLHLPVYVVQHLRDPVEIDDTQIIDYRCARWSYSERRLLGWAETTTRQPAVQNRPAQIIVQRDQLDDDCHARPTEILRKDDTGEILRQQITSYLPTGLGETKICLPERTRVVVQDSGPANPQITETAFAYDRFGNIEQVNALGNLSDPHDDKVIRRVFKPSVGPWIVTLPATEELLNGTTPNARRYRFTNWCYDGDNGTPKGSCSGAPVKGLGLLTAVKNLHDDGTYRTTTFGYDEFGNQTTVTDPRNNTTTTLYDPVRHIFPESACNALKQCTIIVWNHNQGHIDGIVNPNGARTELIPDVFGRTKTAKLPGRGLVSYDYLDWEKPALRRIRQTIADGTADGLWSEMWLDGLERAHQVVKEGDKPGRTFVQQIQYTDGSERPFAVSNWYALPGGGPQATEQFEYDTLGRLVTQTHADNTTRKWIYTNDDARTWIRETNELGKRKKRRYYDAHGRLSEVEQPVGDRFSQLTHSYDAADQLRTVTDVMGNVTTHTYDLLGNLKTTDDPDLGKWSFTWDPASNLETRTDARGRTLTYTHDKLNRPLTKRYQNGAKIVWHYDEKQGHGAGIGRLTSISDPIGNRCPAGRSFNLTYDDAGQVTKDSRCVNGSRQTMGFEFDELGRQKTVIYPDRQRQGYKYDTAGRLSAMPGLVSEFTYDADGLPTSASRADGTVTKWAWDPQRLWIDEITTTSAAGPLLQLGYTHYDDGLVKTSAATPGGPNLTYTYDNMDRLTDVTGDLTQQYRWDTISNLETNSTIGNYTYPRSGPEGCSLDGKKTPCRGPHAAKTAGNHTYDYDANGNTKAIHTRTASGRVQTRQLTWNDDNLIESIQDNSGTWTRMRYDANGDRVDKQRGNRVTRYFGPWLADLPGPGTTTKYYWAGSALVARRDNRGLHFYHQDHLGSTRMLTTGQGRVIARYSYQPFGAPLKHTGPAATDIQFTGQWHDDNTGLIHMGAREYDPVRARFISADTITPDESTQAANRYIYAYGNPLSWTDPTGHQPDDPPLTRGPIEFPPVNVTGEYFKTIGITAEFVGPPQFVGPPNPNWGPSPPGSAPAGESPRITDEDWVWSYKLNLHMLPPDPMVPAAFAMTVYKIYSHGGTMDAQDWVAFSQRMGGVGGLRGMMRGIAGKPVIPKPTTNFGPQQAAKVARLPQDVAVNPTAPAPLPLNRPIGTSPTQNQALQTRIADLQKQGATDFRVNQQQVDINGVRVGTNRPDLQYTLNGQRHYEEFDRSTSNRGPMHQDRIEANDPTGQVKLFKKD
jgi:RHS repeat-associated protein